MASPKDTPGARLNDSVTDGILSLMVDRQRRVRRLVVGKRRERNRSRRWRRERKYLCSASGAVGKFRSDLHHHVILVQRLVHGRDLALPESIVERVVDVAVRNAQPRGRIAIDHNLRFQAFVLLVGVDIAQFGQRAQLLQQIAAPVVQVLQIVALKRVLELRLALPPPMVRSCADCKKQRCAGNTASLRRSRAIT